MSLLHSAINRLYHFWPLQPAKRNSSAGRWRLCRFEHMESRQLLSITAPQIQIGAVYFEDADGQDMVGDLFEITFSGGAAGTQLSALSINTDKVGDGLTIGDCFFDTAEGGLGAFASAPFTIVDQSGIDSVSAEVTDGGTLLTLHFTGFQAGEKLVFTIDVDEQGFLGPNAVAEGNEFEGSILSATFTATHYYDASGSDIFYDAYDYKLSGSGLDLPDDDYDPASVYMPPGAEPGPVYTAGAIFPLQQEPLPITISGYVYEDLNLNNQFESGEPGIAGVTLALYSLGEGGYTPTGKTAVTDANGFYSFTDVLPDTYRIVETQPDGYLSVGASPGTVGGVTRGAVTSVDVLSSINLEGGDDSIENDFGETRPASLSGYVYHDQSNDGVFDSSETGISGATVSLLDAEGNPTGKTATTDSNGFYSFDNLMPDTYRLAENQPAGYFDGLDTAGSVGGVAHNPGDLISDITLTGGVSAKNYDFGELLPASISGHVYVDTNNNGTFDSGEPLLSGVTVYLLDESHTQIASTQTNQNGEYSFTGLAPGVYGTEEVQPTGYFEGGDQVGSAGGSLDGVNRIIDASLGSGVNAVNYDFYELLPATISGYVFQDGPAIKVKKGDPLPNVTSLRDGIFTSDDKPLASVLLQLCDGSGYPLLDSYGNPITTVTNAAGYYEFSGLAPGDYSVVATLPAGYIPGIDTAGSKGGIVVNRYQNLDATLLSTLAVDPQGDAIVKIALNSGDAAVQNNFSVVKIEETSSNSGFGAPQPMPLDPTPPRLPPPGDPLHYGVPYIFPPIVITQALMGGAGGPPGYTWHLSVINGGLPRQLQKDGQFAVNQQSHLFDPDTWTGAEVNQGIWIIADANGLPVKKYRFGLRGAKPVTGDWNGDGVTEIGVFIDGLWFFDLNGNGAWDENDLWAKLGQKGDQPVAGDWDGDGKTDIGIFGPTWIGDTRAVAADPGLPDAQNPPKNRYKNIPPEPEEAAIGFRSMKRTSAGKIRSDLIDHVFQFGAEGDQAIVGDWNGDGVYAIGVFRKGVWFLDMDGDGRWSAADIVVEFGQDGDLPVVGDWSGDGASKIGVYRNGAFYLDANNDHVIDATDKVFELGGHGDKPFAGDFTGSGVDTVGVYQDGGEAVSAPAAVPIPAEN